MRQLCIVEYGISLGLHAEGLHMRFIDRRRHLAIILASLVFAAANVGAPPARAQDLIALPAPEISKLVGPLAAMG